MIKSSNYFCQRIEPLIFKSFTRSFSSSTSIDIKIKDFTMKINFPDEVILKAPLTVDFNVNGACNLNCTWCWGPDHKAKEEVTVDQWKEIAFKLNELGTKNITFTGGETLMKKGLEEILKYVHEDLEMRTTLSTNGILLRRKAQEVLPYVDDLGMPLDGHTREINNIMRVGTPKHFDRVLDSIVLVQQQYPKIDLTVRTVMSAKNMESVPLIGNTMLQHGIDPKKIRWKIYQVNPIGIRKENILNGDWLISSEQFEETMEKVRKLNEKFNKITAQPFTKHVGRYFHIYPDGKSHIVSAGRDGYPVELPTGNIIKNFVKVIENINSYEMIENKIR